MEALAIAEENNDYCVEESISGKSSSSPSSLKQITDPVVYKLVRVEGDGRLVPATDDEVMEVEDLLDDEKSELPLIRDAEQTEGSVFNEGFSSGKDNLEGFEGLSPLEKAEFDAKELNPPLEEIVPYLSPKSNDSSANQLGSVEACLKPADVLTKEKSTAPTVGTSLKPDFSLLKGEICLDNLSIKELHEMFKATFGRETSVKDKLWLKRRIAMGLTNSCDVSTTTFIIKDKTLVHKKVKEESSNNADDSLSKDHISGETTDDCQGSPTSTSNKMHDWQVVAGKTLRKTKEEYECVNEDLHMEERAAKRLRRPTKRYIEELSEVETRECSTRLVSSVKNSRHEEFSPKSCVEAFHSVVSDRREVVTRQDSLGGSGVQVPYVFRVRRGRPRKNIMALMKYHPSGIGVAAKLVKKALGVRVSQQDGNGTKIWSDGAAPKQFQQPIVAESEKENKTVATCVDEQQQKDLQMENINTSQDDFDDNMATVPTPKGGIRRKHHRAWTLSEVMKLVEGVSRYGAGRWSEIKRLAFASYTYRTSVDLKDKWRNLLRASFSQTPQADNGLRNSRKHASMPIPAHILSRVRELAEMHAQATPDLKSSNKFGVGRNARGIDETMSGYL